MLQTAPSLPEEEQTRLVLELSGELNRGVLCQIVTCLSGTAPHRRTDMLSGQPGMSTHFTFTFSLQFLSELLTFVCS